MVDREQSARGLYTPELEHDACGIGFVAHLKNRKSHEVVTQALDMLARMEHRGGQGCDPCSGDGAGILLQKPHEFLLEEAVKLGIKLPSFEKYGVGVVLFPNHSTSPPARGSVDGLQGASAPGMLTQATPGSKR